MIDDPLKAIDALNAVKSEAVSNTDIAYFESKGIWDSILNIRNILAHNCPQNRNRGDHNAFGMII
ncbi:MAG: hypothetical protein HWD59_03285 [Coxiellaceae bacterium]|nr:MAG: hypothetical protein HWD59_03285 [Coxiellaceae bacterium]